MCGVVRNAILIWIHLGSHFRRLFAWQVQVVQGRFCPPSHLTCQSCWPANKRHDSEIYTTIDFRLVRIGTPRTAHLARPCV